MDLEWNFLKITVEMSKKAHFEKKVQNLQDVEILEHFHFCRNDIFHKNNSIRNSYKAISSFRKIVKTS